MKSPHRSWQTLQNSGSNLAAAFIFLPRRIRHEMTALYAFCREVDDIADNDSISVKIRRTNLAKWRADISRTCNGGEPHIEVIRELQPVIESRGLEFRHFDELIRGMEDDLTIHRYRDFSQLEQYCHRAASVVGLLSIEIFGYTDPACREYAVHLGKALQLTNILRDIKEDAGRGRIYLPQNCLKEHGVDWEDILAGRFSPGLATALFEVADRATAFYRRATDTLPDDDRHSMVAAETMGAVYWQLLRILRNQNFDVFNNDPVRLGASTKLRIFLRTWLRTRLENSRPNYG